MANKRERSVILGAAVILRISKKLNNFSLNTAR